MTARASIPGALALAAALVGLASRGHAGEPVAVADQLLAVKHQRECRITTTGRKSGRPHSVPIWFVVDGDVLYLSTMDPTRDWVKNALATPTVTVEFGELTVRGRFRDVTGTELDGAVREGLRRKYWIASIAGWFGQGPKRTFVIDQIEAVPPAAPAP